MIVQKTWVKFTEQEAIIKKFVAFIGVSDVLYVSTPVPDGAGSGTDLLHLGGRVSMAPFGKIFVLC